MIREFDADEDEKLDQAEFQQLMLPATNLQLRKQVEARPHANGYRADEPLDDNLCKEMAQLLQMELVFQAKRDNVRRSLLSQHDFTKERAFKMLAR